MYFRTILALLAAPLLVLAQNPNPFKIPQAGLSATAGEPLTLKWEPTTQGTVTLVLRSGSSNDLNAGTVIASSIPNSGSYTWTPADSITRGSDYAVEIVDDADPTQTNYTPYFVIDSTNTVASTTGQVTLGATKTSIESQTTGKTTAGGSSSSSGGSSSSGSAMSSSGGGSTMTTGGGRTTLTGGNTSPTNGASSSGASFQPTGQSAGPSSTSGNAAPRATAMAGMLGLVALGAMAL